MVAKIVNQMFRYAEKLVKNSDPVAVIRGEIAMDNYKYILSKIGSDVYDKIQERDPKYISRLEKRFGNIAIPLPLKKREQLDKICGNLRKKARSYGIYKTIQR
jgi:hypothetical protein